jgi:hypothetical protein
LVLETLEGLYYLLLLAVQLVLEALLVPEILAVPYYLLHQEILALPEVP